MIGRMCFILALLLSLISCVAHAAKLPKRTAHYYQAMADQYLGQEITVDVSCVIPGLPRGPDGMKMFRAYTYHAGENGGIIDVAVPIDGVKDFLSRYGTVADERGGRVKTKPLHGILCKGSGERVYVKVRQD